MNKTTAALKLAEEALNAMLTHMGMDEDEWNKPTFDQARKAITALREALAQPQGDPVAYLCGKCVDNFTVDGYETCEQGDYGSFPVYRHPPSVEVETIDGHSKHWWQHEINNARAEGYERGFNSGKEATKEKAARLAYRVCVENRNEMIGDKVHEAIKDMR